MKYLVKRWCKNDQQHVTSHARLCDAVDEIMYLDSVGIACDLVSIPDCPPDYVPDEED